MVVQSYQRLKLETRFECKMKEEWNAKQQLHLHPNVSTANLNTCTNIIKSQGLFNAHNAVLNKK